MIDTPFLGKNYCNDHIYHDINKYINLYINIHQYKLLQNAPKSPSLVIKGQLSI